MEAETRAARRTESSERVTALLPIALIVLALGTFPFSMFMIARQSGWAALAASFPDRAAELSLFTLRFQSGFMQNNMRFGSILRFDVCPGGLRVSQVPVFGWFCKPFFVPWNEISVRYRRRFVSQVFEMTFGQPRVGSLAVIDTAGAKLVQRIPVPLRETQPSDPEPSGAIARRLFRFWLLQTTLAALFFVVVPRLIPNNANPPSIPIALGVPAGLFAVVALAQYIVARSNR